MLITSQNNAWNWRKYQQPIIVRSPAAMQPAWAAFDWEIAINNYQEQVHALCGYTRIFAQTAPVSLEGIFTEVFILEKLLALQPQDIQQLNTTPPMAQKQRVPALRLLQSDSGHRLFILGKPGAGKTTFLRHLALEAVKQQLNQVPLFITVKEWCDSDLSLHAYLMRQFHICHFPDTALFLEHLLSSGQTLVLFDGLDEVSQSYNRRQQVTDTILAFCKHHPSAQCIITCRLAATDYTFKTFSYVQISDFDDKQIRTFVKRWFRKNPIKRDAFLQEFAKPEHRGLRELARTPLLLTLLCLVFSDNMTFGQRRADIYIDALDALLRKWDTSRNIRRDEIYRDLSPVRKHQLFARIAAETFEQGDYFFPQAELERKILRYIRNLPRADTNNRTVTNGTTLLKSIEAQHSILVESAQGIYSFAHLTFQEYYTARYIVSNALAGTLNHLLYKHLTSTRWHEVILLTASLLDDADRFFEIFLNALGNLIFEDETLVAFFSWATRKATAGTHPYHLTAMRSFYCYLAFSYDLDLTLAHPLALARSRAYDRALALDMRFAQDLALMRMTEADCILDLVLMRVLTVANALAHTHTQAHVYEYHLNITHNYGRARQLSTHSDLTEFQHALADLPLPAVSDTSAVWQTFAAALQQLLQAQRDIGYEWDFSLLQAKCLDRYFYAMDLLIHCLDLAYVSDRRGIEEELLRAES